MASDFLKNMAKKQAEKIDKEYGTDAYGGSNWRATALQPKAGTQSSPAAPAGGTTSAGRKASSFLQGQARLAGERIDAEYGADAYGGSNYQFNRPQTPKPAAQDPAKWTDVATAQTELEAWGKELTGMQSRIDAKRTAAERAEGELQSAYSEVQRLQADTRLGSDPILQMGYQNTVNRYNTALTTYQAAAKEHDDLVTSYNDLLGQYETGYNAYKDLLANQANMAADYRAKAEAAEQEATTARNVLVGLNRYGTQAQKDEYTAKAEAAEALAAEMREKAEAAEGYYYGSIPMMDDYTQYSAVGESKRGSLYGTKEQQGDHLYDFINDLPADETGEYGYRDAVRVMSFGTGQQKEYGAYTAYSYMTPEEIGIYNYIYATRGRADAEGFLDQIMNSLNARMGAEDFEDLTGVGKALYWIPAGVDRFAGGMAQLFSEEALPTSPIQFTSGMVSQEAHETSPVLGTMYDLGTVVSNMAPSVLLSYLTAGLGDGAGLSTGATTMLAQGTTAASIGLSAGGNAYQQKVTEGYTPEEARSYATLVGGSEALLTYLLGGLGKSAGVSTEAVLTKVAPKIAAIDNAFLRMVAGGGTKLLVRGTSEGIEEGLQAFLEPAFATLILDESYDWGQNMEDAAYSFMMGFLTAGIFEGVELVASGKGSASGFTVSDLDGYMTENGVDYFEGCETLEEVEAKYRELARENHPDLGGSQEVMADINRQHDMQKAFYKGQSQGAEQAQAENKAPAALPPLTTQEAATAPQTAENVAGMDVGNIREAAPAAPVTRTEQENMHVAPVTEAEPQGLSLPTLEPETQQQTGLPPLTRPVQEAPAQTPAADIQNGGMTNEFAEGADLPDGNGGRLYGARPGEQAGGLAAGTGATGGAFEQGRAAGARQNFGKAVRGEKVSSIDLGISRGTEAPSVTVLEESGWDDALRSTAERVYQETGRSVTYVLGSIPVRNNDGTTTRVRGVYTDGGIIIQADNLRVTVDQIADHEIFHDKAFQTPGLVRDLEERIVERYGREEFARVVDTYVQKLRGVIDLSANATPDQIDEAYLKIYEEILADAYAGINAFSAHAERYNETVEQELDERGLGRGRETAAATDRTTGPPRDRYSYGGANANTADQEALRRAQEMERRGEAADTIFRETGWYVGMDGKWRFEIDDSGMKYHKGGDAAFRRNHPEYVEYQTLLDQMLTGVWTGENEERLQELDDIWGREYARLSERVSRGNAVLEDILDHEPLYQAYPQLRRAPVRFAETEPGVNGSYDPETNTITLNEKYRDQWPEGTLIHEVQHAIQRAEGFAAGSSPEYWGSDAAASQRMEAVTRIMDEIENLNEMLREDSEDADFIRADIEALEQTLESLNYHLYENTAGEIEARDVSTRRVWDQERRRNTMPAAGDENTVFADRDTEYGYAMSAREQDSVKEQLRENQAELNKRAPVATVNDEGRAGMSMDDFRRKITEDLRKTGYRVDRQDFGVIEFTEKEINTSLNYLQTEAEAAAYQAIPQVLKRGLDISGHENHKGRRYDTVTIAAPIILNGERANMAVVVKKTKGNRYKVHRVLTPSGENFVLPEKQMQSLPPPVVSPRFASAPGGMDQAINSASTDSVTQNNAESNTDFSEGAQRFSMDEPVEEAGNLVAVHNMDGEKIDRTLALGAWPSPSIAIVQADQGHSNYGEYTALFRRQSIDPQVDSRNRVYGSDAWTPTHNQTLVESEVDYGKKREFERLIEDLSRDIGGGAFNMGSVLSRAGIEETSKKTISEIAEQIAKYPDVQAAYLATQGEDVEVQRREKNYHRFGNEAVRRYTQMLTTQELAALDVAVETRDRAAIEAAAPQIKDLAREVYEDVLRNRRTMSGKPITEEVIQLRLNKYVDDISDFHVESFIQAAWEMAQDGANTGEIDRGSMAQALNDMVDKRDVARWAENLLDGLLISEGIYNGVDVITDEGRRTFAETHVPVTAENLVEAMYRDNAGRGVGAYGMEASGLQSAASPAYQTVDDIRADSHRLGRVSEEELQALKDEIDERLSGLCEELDALPGASAYNLSDAMINAAGLRYAEEVIRSFEQDGIRAMSVGTALDLIEVFEMAAQLPTEYFEAKPERVVKLDEAVAVLAPDDAPAERIDRMKAAGMNVVLYEAGNEQDRLEVLNQQADKFQGARFSVDEEEQQEKPKRKATKPVAESLPIIAKRDLRNNLLGLFSIPEGQKAEMGAIIDQYADRLLRTGALTERDRSAFFDRMYDAGVMDMEADEYYKLGRDAVKSGRIFVSEGERHEFGDDWNNFRKRAFGAGIYLTNSHGDRGVGVWNMELAEMLPGLFDAEELDSRTILERIVQVAEEGKDEKVSLAEYTAQLAEREYIPEDELLDNMERQMDWALRTFAEKAKLEIHLRDRTGVKIAQERERAAQSSTKARERETIRRAKERDDRKAMMQRQRENRELRELQQKTLKQLQWLSKNRFRAPEELQGTWDEVLGDIDIYAAGAANEMNWSKKYDATWQDLAQMYKEAQKNDPNFLPSKELERIVMRLDGEKIADMDIDALQDLYKAAVGVRTEFYNRNNVINDEMHRLFAEVYTDSKAEIETAPGGYSGGAVDRFMNLEQLTPMNVLQRMGGWNPDGAFYSMAKQLEQGERDVRRYTVRANAALEDFLTEHEEWVKKADGQGKDGIWYELEVPQLLELGMGDKPIFGPTVTVYMTPAQKVHLYLESKSTDNLRHMTGGRTFADKELYSQGKRTEALAQGKTVRLAPESVKKIVSDLTEEERELARVLENYYNGFAKGEINRISNILYGYDKAQSRNYAPIYTNKNYTKSEIGVFDTTAEGVGNLKSRQYAVNPSYNISAFDAFERHVEQTGRFVGMSIPARNWQTLLNWREKNNSTADVITHKWGEEGKRYITELIERLQGGVNVERDSVSSAADKLLSNYISAIFGANPSIVLKQLGSIPLASVYLDLKNLPSLSQLRGIDRNLIGRYTSDLAWRTMGYTTPETKQLKENPNWTQTNKAVRFAFGGGAITAMDGWAASTLWPWAENKVRRDFPELEMGTQEQIDAGQSPFYRKVAEVFNQALSRSQSVSDETHQGRLRKSRNPVTRALTMFKSDASQTYNAIRQKIGEAKFYERTGADPETVRKAKKAAGGAFVAAIGGYLWAEAVTLLIALWKNQGKYYRDDEDELTAESVAKEMAMGLLGDMAGIVTGGEELMEILGNLITGDTWYGIETPGLEQVTDIVELILDKGQGGVEVLKEAADIVKNGGDLGEYLSTHGNDILGGVKELAQAAATYIPGLPVNNLEAYMLGAIKWIAPELAVAYEDLLAEADKSGLSGLTGDALAQRMGTVLESRVGEINETTATELAALYEAGYKVAAPSKVPSSISVNGDERKLAAHQQQTYRTVWQGVVNGALDDLVASDEYANADVEMRSKMVSALYDYAAEQAKVTLFDDYEADNTLENGGSVVRAGGSLADWAAWKGMTTGMKAAEKYALLQGTGWTDPVKQAVAGTIMGTDMKTESGADTAYAKMLRVTESGAGMDQYLQMRMDETVDKYLEGIEAGLDTDAAYELAGTLSELQPEEGKKSVTSMQELEAIGASDLSQEEKISAMGAVMGTELTTESGKKSQYAMLLEAVDAGYSLDDFLALKEADLTKEGDFGKVMISGGYGIGADQFIRYKEALVAADAMNTDPKKRNESIDQSETTAAISGMLGLTNEQKAVLWQLQNKTWKADKNPFSPSVGAAVKEAMESEEVPGLSLPSLGGATEEPAELPGLSLPSLDD